MSAAVNKVILLGYVGTEVELRFTPTGIKRAGFRLATSEKWNSDGKLHEHTEWHNIIAWGRQAEIAKEFLRVGDKVFLEGRLRTHLWNDDQHNRHSKVSIHIQRLTLLESPPKETEIEEDNELEVDYDYPF